MKEESCRQFVTDQNGRQVILKFPETSKEEEQIKSEVKEILSAILKEQLAKIS